MIKTGGRDRKRNCCVCVFVERACVMEGGEERGRGRRMRFGFLLGGLTTTDPHPDLRHVHAGLFFASGLFGKESRVVVFIVAIEKRRSLFFWGLGGSLLHPFLSAPTVQYPFSFRVLRGRERCLS